MPQYQSYLKDCNCKGTGIILYEGKTVCRWCRKPYEKGGLLFYEPEQFEKEKEVKPNELLVTEDGVKLYEGDKYWRISTNCDWDCISYNADAKLSIKDKGRGIFYYEENAKEYILQNKPMQVSMKDVLSIWAYDYQLFKSVVESYFKSKINP